MSIYTPENAEKLVNQNLRSLGQPPFGVVRGTVLACLEPDRLPAAAVARALASTATTAVEPKSFVLTSRE